MSFSRSSRVLITSGSSGFGVAQRDRFSRQEWDPRIPQTGASLEATKLDRAGRLLLDFVKTPPRILLVDAALLLHELHLTLLRSIPAIVECLTSCTEMYLHDEHGYVLVILVLPPKSRETAEAADYVRHRWRAARILLLENESAMIDDWLYDARIDPHFHPATVREAAIRLMAGQEYWVPA
jgi:hypothetical protein